MRGRFNIKTSPGVEDWRLQRRDAVVNIYLIVVLIVVLIISRHLMSFGLGMLAEQEQEN